MPLNEIRPGLRVVNKSIGLSKVTIHVPPGDSLEVSEDVAAQLAAQTQDFAEVGTDAAERAVPYPPVEDEPETVEPVAEKPKPAKRAAKKPKPAKRAAKKAATKS